MPISPFMAAINQVCDEKGLSKEEVIEAVEYAVGAAYRKEYGHPKEVIRAKIESETGKFNVFQEFEVVKKEEEIENSHSQMLVKDAKKISPKAKAGEIIIQPLPYKDDFGRIAAMTAKQVIIQRLREAERNMLYKEYKQREGQVVSTVVQQIEGENIIVNLGKTNAFLPPSEQVNREYYYIGQRLRVYVAQVGESNRGPRIVVSRSHPGLLDGLFRLEVPEVNNEAVQIKSIVREAGFRAKVAVHTNDKQLDPVGTCVGQRGARIQAILAEIGDEKIDIIIWDKNLKKYLANALSPAEVQKITLSKDKKLAKVKVADDQLSLAIGRNGENVRLASKLTNIEVDIIKPPLDQKKVEIPTTAPKIQAKPKLKPKSASQTKTKKGAKIKNPAAEAKEMKGKIASQPKPELVKKTKAKKTVKSKKAGRKPAKKTAEK